MKTTNTNTNTMKTTIKKSGNKSILLTMLLLFTSICLKAQEENKIMEIVHKNMSGIYIIGGVLAFGIGLYVVSVIVSKYSKDDDASPKNVHPISHRHKHPHRVIKKSA